MNVLARICRWAATAACWPLNLAPPAHAQNPGRGRRSGANSSRPEGGPRARQLAAARTDAHPTSPASCPRPMILFSAQAAALLGIIGGDDVVPMLSHALYDPVPFAFTPFARSESQRDERTPLLCDVLRGRDSRVRRTARRWLAALPGDEARFAVEQAATDPDPSVRRDAKRALATWAKPTP